MYVWRCMNDAKGDNNDVFTLRIVYLVQNWGEGSGGGADHCILQRRRGQGGQCTSQYRACTDIVLESHYISACTNGVLDSEYKRP